MSLTTPVEKPKPLSSVAGERPLSAAWYVQVLSQGWFTGLQLVLASFLVQLFALAIPVFYMVIFDRVFGRQNLATLDVIGIAVLGIIGFDLVVKMLRSYLATHQMLWLDALTGKLLLSGLMQSSQASSGSPPLSEPFADLLKLNRIVAQTLLIAVPDAVFSLIIAAMLFYLNPVLAAVSLLSLPPMMLYMLWQGPRARHRAGAMLKKQRQLHRHYMETLRNRETLESLNVFQTRLNQLQVEFQELLGKGFGALQDTVAQGNIPSFFTNLGSLITLYVGAHLVLQGQISFGVYLAINMLGRIVLTSFQKALQSFIQYREASDSLGGQKADALTQALSDYRVTTDGDDTQAAPRYAVSDIRGDLSVRELGYCYNHSGQYVLKDVSFDLRAGERVVITGKSGAGKSTLIKLMAGLYTPSTGEVLLDNMNLSLIRPEDVRQLIGLSMQKSELFEGSLRENLTLGKPDADLQALTRAIEMSGLDEVIRGSDGGLESRIHSMGVNLSGGQAQRIALARMLLMNPSVLLLDESLNALPPAMQVQILNNLHQNFRQSTCVFVSGFLPMHQAASRILVLDEGRIVEQGTFQELSAQRGGVYHRLHLSGEMART